VATALEAGYDLGALALCFVAIALLLAAKGLVQAVAGLFDFSVFGVRPLHSLAAGLENHVLGALNDAIAGVERAATSFVSGLIDSFGMLIALPALAILGTKAALSYLWNTALDPRIDRVTASIKATANAAATRLETLTDVVAADLARAENFARDRATAALSSAKAYVESRIEGALAALRADIAAALATAESYADQAVSRLRAAEDSAIANAVGLAVAAEQAGKAAAAAALATAEGDIAAGVSAAEAAAAGALAASDAAGKAALDVVRSVAVTAEQDIASVLGDLDARTVAALIASIPALATIVHAIATEAGLENAECRSKVKGICGTDASSWLGLLAGLAAVGAGFDLRALAGLANEVVRDVAGVVKELAEAA
jgi:hypothetical protein